MIRMRGASAAILCLALASTTSAQMADARDAARVALRAEILRSAGDDLRALLTDSREGVRARACEALGRIGLPVWLPRLIEATRDESAVVRAAAAVALGQLDYTLELEAELSARDRAAEALIRLLDDSSVDAAVAAGGSLGRVARRPDALDAWLARSATLADAEVVAATVYARGSMIGAEVGPLADLVAAGARAIRHAVAVSLGSTDDPARAPLLDRLLDDEEAGVRIAALRGLRFAPARIASARTSRSLRFGDWREQCAALDWIGSAWRREAEAPIDDDTYTAVLRRSLDRNLSVRRCALGALASRPERTVAVDRLLEALNEADAAVRATAGELLAGLSPEVASVAVARVVSRGEDGASDLEGAAYVRLRGRAGQNDVATLQELVTGGRPWTALAALEQLEQTDAAAAWTSARAAVRGGHVAGARAAPRVLARLAGLVERAEERAAAVDELWARMRDGEDRAARGAALEALVRIAPEIVGRRLTALPEMLPAVLRRRAYVLLSGDPRVGTRVRGEAAEWLAGDEPPPDLDSTIAAALEAIDSAPLLELVGEDRTMSIRLDAGRSPLAVARLVDRLRDGEMELGVDMASDAFVMGGRGDDRHGRIEPDGVFPGALPPGAVVLPGVAPGDPAVYPELRVVLVAGRLPAATPIGFVEDPVRTAGRWQPGERLLLRIDAPSHGGTSGGREESPR